MSRFFYCLFMLSALVLLGSCRPPQETEKWTTIATSKKGEPTYSLQVSDKEFKVKYDGNGSAREDWDIEKISFFKNLDLKLVNEEEIKGREGATGEFELTGQGMAYFTMVYRGSVDAKRVHMYFDVVIATDQDQKIDPKRSSMTLVKTETDYDDAYWQTITESKEEQPFYRLEYYDDSYRILYDSSGSARKNWYLDDYNPEDQLTFKNLNENQIKDKEGGTAQNELIGRGPASFVMVYESYKGQALEKQYYQVEIAVSSDGQVNPTESKMTYLRTETSPN